MFEILKKYFNIQNSSQKALIVEEKIKYNEIIDAIRTDDNSNSREITNRLNGRCPNCGETTKIVNKIQQTHGSGSVSGSFSLGFGSVYGSSSLDTDPVNHCNGCGNQWKKYRSNHKSSKDVSRSMLRSVESILEGNDYRFQLSDYEKLKHFHAETIEVVNEDLGGHWLTGQREFTLKELRTMFKSVFDKQ